MKTKKEKRAQEIANFKDFCLYNVKLTAREDIDYTRKKIRWENRYVLKAEKLSDNNYKTLDNLTPAQIFKIMRETMNSAVSFWIEHPEIEG